MSLLPPTIAIPVSESKPKQILSPDSDIAFRKEKTGTNITFNLKKDLNKTESIIEVIELDDDDDDDDDADVEDEDEDENNDHINSTVFNNTKSKSTINHFVARLSTAKNGNIRASIEFDDKKTPARKNFSSRIMHMNIGVDCPRLSTVINNPVISPTTLSSSPIKSSLPKFIHVIETSSPLPSSSKTLQLTNNEDEYHQHRLTNQCDSYVSEKWSSNRSEETATSPFRSNSETSSALSSCSSDHETNNDYTNDVVTLSHDVSPDSPDSGLSGSVNSTDDKISLYEDLDDLYQTIFTKCNQDLSYVDNVTGDKCDSLLDLIQIKTHNSRQIENLESEWKDDNLIRGPIIIVEEEEFEHITREDNESIIIADDEINCSFSSDDSKKTIIDNESTIILDEIPQNCSFSSDSSDQTINNDEDDFEDIQFEKEVEALVQSIPKGFDSVLRTMSMGPEINLSENDNQLRAEDEGEEKSVNSTIDFGFDFLTESSSTIDLTPFKSKSFDWSIKTNSASDMQSMIKQIKINAQNIKIKNNDGKKQQTFFCQWHDCDWPGNYEDLAEHLREIHVELQPFLDANGKVIKWNKQKLKTNNNNNNKEEDGSIVNDDFDGSSSQTTLDDDMETDDDEDSMTEDDDQPSIAPDTRRRSKRLNSSSNTFDSLNHSLSKKDLRNGDKTEKFVCLWRGCKVFGKPSLSRHWIERHVLEQHSGPKPFKCIVDSCGQRFRTQNQLEKHVNMHFKTNSNNSGPSATDLKLSIDNDDKNNHNININKIQKINFNENDETSASKDCCKCLCHSSLNCDNISTLFNDESPPLVMNKNRSPSVDSSISFQSSDSSSFSTQCLSKQTSNLEQYCHTECCCMNKEVKSKIKNNKKRSTTIPQVKSVANTDYLDDEFALRLAYEVRARDTLLANMKSYPAYEKWIRLPCGTFKKIKTTISKPQQKSIHKIISQLNKLKKSNQKKGKKDHSDYDHDDHEKEVPSMEVFNVFKKELFTLNKKQENVPFDSDLIACKVRSNDEFFYTLRWHPQGILTDENIQEDKLDKKRIIKLRLPNNIQKSSEVIFKRKNDKLRIDISKRKQIQSSKSFSRFELVQVKQLQEFKDYKPHETDAFNSEFNSDYDVDMASICEDDNIQMKDITITKNSRKRKLNDKEETIVNQRPPKRRATNLF